LPLFIRNAFKTFQGDTKNEFFKDFLNYSDLIFMQTNVRSVLLLFSLSLFLWSCRETGLQGSAIPLKFKGVTRAEAISPNSVELNWELQPRFTAYRIYRKGISAIQKNETFAVTQINNLEPATTYEFGVTGLKPWQV
jgi:hypothetical protein